MLGTNTEAHPSVFFLCGQIGCMTSSAIRYMYLESESETCSLQF